VMRRRPKQPAGMYLRGITLTSELPSPVTTHLTGGRTAACSIGRILRRTANSSQIQHRQMAVMSRWRLSADLRSLPDLIRELVRGYGDLHDAAPPGSDVQARGGVRARHLAAVSQVHGGRQACGTAACRAYNHICMVGSQPEARMSGLQRRHKDAATRWEPWRRINTTLRACNIVQHWQDTLAYHNSRIVRARERREPSTARAHL